MIGVTGIVMTKLEGTARGGVLVSLAEKYGIPVHYIGVGESAEDLRPFEAEAFAGSGRARGVGRCHSLGLDSGAVMFFNCSHGAGACRADPGLTRRGKGASPSVAVLLLVRPR